MTERTIALSAQKETSDSGAAWASLRYSPRSLAVLQGYQRFYLLKQLALPFSDSQRPVPRWCGSCYVPAQALRHLPPLPWFAGALRDLPSTSQVEHLRASPWLD
jgi:hypothetical protein